MEVMNSLLRRTKNEELWLVLLSLGLLMAFSASAFAVDVQFSGSYFAAECIWIKQIWQKRYYCIKAKTQRSIIRE